MTLKRQILHISAESALASNREGEAPAEPRFPEQEARLGRSLALPRSTVATITV